MATDKQPAKMWSGRFRAAADPQFEAWQRSIGFDWRLLDQEVAASKAHASALRAQGRNSDEPKRRISCGRHLDAIAAAHASDAGKEQVRTHPTAEDIHHFVELSLVERVGSLGLKLHTGRSRNEQIATDLRLYVRSQIEDVVESLAAWAESLIEQARAAGECSDAELHASPARRASARCSLASGLR
jgi:argininosuccinate lyase